MRRNELFSKNVLRALSVGLSAYMALQPVVVMAEDGEPQSNDTVPSTDIKSSDSGEQATAVAQESVSQVIETANTANTLIVEYPNGDKAIYLKKEDAAYINTGNIIENENTANKKMQSAELNDKISEGAYKAGLSLIDKQQESLNTDTDNAKTELSDATQAADEAGKAREDAETALANVNNASTSSQAYVYANAAREAAGKAASEAEAAKAIELSAENRYNLAVDEYNTFMANLEKLQGDVDSFSKVASYDMADAVKAAENALEAAKDEAARLKDVKDNAKQEWNDAKKEAERADEEYRAAQKAYEDAEKVANDIIDTAKDVLNNDKDAERSDNIEKLDKAVEESLNQKLISEEDKTAYDEASEKVKDAISAVDELNETIEELSDRLDLAKEGKEAVDLDNAKKAYDEQEKVVSGLIENAKEALGEAKDKLDELETALDEAKNKKDDDGKSYNDYETAIEGLQKEIDDLEDAVEEAENELDKIKVDRLLAAQIAYKNAKDEDKASCREVVMQLLVGAEYGSDAVVASIPEKEAYSITSNGQVYYVKFADNDDRYLAMAAQEKDDFSVKDDNASGIITKDSNSKKSEIENELRRTYSEEEYVINISDPVLDKDKTEYSFSVIEKEDVIYTRESFKEQYDSLSEKEFNKLGLQVIVDGKVYKLEKYITVFGENWYGYWTRNHISNIPWASTAWSGLGSDKDYAGVGLYHTTETTVIKSTAGENIHDILNDEGISTGEKYAVIDGKTYILTSSETVKSGTEKYNYDVEIRQKDYNLSGSSYSDGLNSLDKEKVEQLESTISESNENIASKTEEINTDNEKLNALKPAVDEAQEAYDDQKKIVDNLQKIVDGNEAVGSLYDKLVAAKNKLAELEKAKDDAQKAYDDVKAEKDAAEKALVTAIDDKNKALIDLADVVDKKLLVSLENSKASLEETANGKNNALQDREGASVDAEALYKAAETALNNANNLVEEADKAYKAVIEAQDKFAKDRHLMTDDEISVMMAKIENLYEDWQNKVEIAQKAQDDAEAALNAANEALSRADAVRASEEEARRRAAEEDGGSTGGGTGTGAGADIGGGYTLPGAEAGAIDPALLEALAGGTQGAGVAGARVGRRAAGGTVDGNVGGIEAGIDGEAGRIQLPESTVEEQKLPIDDKDIVTIKDEEVAKAAVGAETHRMSWWWLLLVALGIGTEETYRRNKKKKDEEAALGAELGNK